MECLITFLITRIIYLGEATQVRKKDILGACVWPDGKVVRFRAVSESLFTYRRSRKLADSWQHAEGLARCNRQG